MSFMSIALTQGAVEILMEEKLFTPHIAVQKQSSIKGKEYLGGLETKKNAWEKNNNNTTTRKRSKR